MAEATEKTKREEVTRATREAVAAQLALTAEVRDAEALAAVALEALNTALETALQAQKMVGRLEQQLSRMCRAAREWQFVQPSVGGDHGGGEEDVDDDDDGDDDDDDGDDDVMNDVGVNDEEDDVDDYGESDDGDEHGDEDGGELQQRSAGSVLAVRVRGRGGRGWTEEEVAELQAGVRQHGEGRWTAILADARQGSVLSSRSGVDLKDKWRNLKSNGKDPYRRVGSSSGAGPSAPHIEELD